MIRVPEPVASASKRSSRLNARSRTRSGTCENAAVGTEGDVRDEVAVAAQRPTKLFITGVAPDAIKLHPIPRSRLRRPLGQQLLDPEMRPEHGAVVGR